MAFQLVLALAVLLGCIATWAVATPLIGDASYRFDDREWTAAELPLFVDTEGSRMDIAFTIDAAAVRVGTYVVKPDDCIESMTINGVELPAEVVAFCDYGQGKDVRLGEYLRAGANDVALRLRDDGGKGGVRVAPSPHDPLAVVLAIVACVAVVQCILFAFRHLRAEPKRYAVLLILIAGIALRVLYAGTTHWNERGHDTDAHIDYIEYVAANAAIPPAEDGWEYHQPPLYYASMAVPFKVARALGGSDDVALAVIQLVSLVLSIVTLALACRIGTLLFPKQAERPELYAFCAIVASFPSLVFLSSRISNDALFTVLGFAATLVLLRWWRTKRWKEWYVLCALSALAFVTKNTGIICLGVAGLCLLLLPGKPWKSKAVHALGGFLVVALIAGWYPILRIAIEEDTNRTLSLGNMEMNGALGVENGIANLLTFHPLEVLSHPFNNPWEDDTRREFFLEYLFRSAFFGEFRFESFEALAPTLLFVGLLTLPLALFGIFRSIARTPRRDAPLLLLLVAYACASAAYRILFPFAPNQDFRFILPVLVPAAFFVCNGFGGLPRALRHSAHTVAALFAGLCALFILFIVVA